MKLGKFIHISLKILYISNHKCKDDQKDENRTDMPNKTRVSLRKFQQVAVHWLPFSLENSTLFGLHPKHKPHSCLSVKKKEKKNPFFGLNNLLD